VKNFNIIIVLIAFLFIITLSCSNIEKDNSGVSRNDFLIDSMIVVNKLNDKAILLLLGSDAVAAIKTDRGIVIIDAGISTCLTLRYRRKIENEFQSNNFVYVINTHSHSDHNGGNSQFLKAKIIGQENGLKEIATQLSNPDKKNRISEIVKQYESKLQEFDKNTEEWYDAFLQKTRYSFALFDVEMQIPVKRPELTFSDSLKINMGDVGFEMVYFGICHSNSDILIYIPELKILFTGDLFFKYGRLSMADTSLKDKEKWKKAIAWIDDRILNIQTIIGGHGELLSIKDLNSFKKNILEKCQN
jgi:glyoxylase-like metal-dependent hydrolase (beta-lactamase superfamily II)